MKRLCINLLIAIPIVAIVVLLVGRRRSMSHHESLREHQHSPEGKSVVEEWGEESFPASDAPQSW